jgi:hypothetical protein
LTSIELSDAHVVALVPVMTPVRAWALLSNTPRLLPTTVIIDAAVEAALVMTRLLIPASPMSYEATSEAVWSGRSAEVTSTDRPAPRPIMSLAVTLVSDVHADDSDLLPPDAIIADMSTAAIRDPTTVTREAAVPGMLVLTMPLGCGASDVNATDMLPVASRVDDVTT